MAINYSSLLTDEQKRQIIQARLDQFVSEAYQHSLNKQIAEMSNNQEGIDSADSALTILDTAISIHQDELAKLNIE